ncbi:MAG: hypothetical protein ACREPM_11685 [Gemmatimonadaceae bacterium]
MPRHTLNQTWNNTTAAQVFFLAAGDDIDTGAMSDCVSVVVLLAPAAGRFTQAVGQHGGGGIGNVNMASILANVPVAGRAGMLVLIITGHNALHEDYDSSNNRAVRAAKGRLQAAGFRTIKIARGFSGAIIDDAGNMTQY